MARVRNDHFSGGGNKLTAAVGEDAEALASLLQGGDGYNAGNVADLNAVGGIPLVHRVAVTALTGDLDVVLTHKSRVIDVWAVQKGGAGGAGDTITVKNGAAAITNALDMNVADTVIVRAGMNDDANHEIAAGGTLRISGASAVTADVYVSVIRVA